MARVNPYLQPTCAWCEDPATDQVLTARRPTKDGTTRAIYTWMCDQCAAYYREEKEWQRGR